LLVGCKSNTLKGVPAHYVEDWEWHDQTGYAVQALEVFNPEEIDGKLKPRKYKSLWNRLDYAEAYGRSVNDWRNDTRPEEWSE
jgi:hypothetical protein